MIAAAVRCVPLRLVVHREYKCLLHDQNDVEAEGAAIRQLMKIKKCHSTEEDY